MPKNETAFPLCRATDSLWNRKVVSLLSSVMTVVCLLMSCTSSMACWLHDPAVSMATLKRIIIVVRLQLNNSTLCYHHPGHVTWPNYPSAILFCWWIFVASYSFIYTLPFILNYLCILPYLSDAFFIASSVSSLHSPWTVACSTCSAVLSQYCAVFVIVHYEMQVWSVHIWAMWRHKQELLTYLLTYLLT